MPITRTPSPGGDLSELLGVKLKHLPDIEMRLAGPDMLTGGEQ